ncbi:unnamed protein product [Prunus armeniaca]
MKQTAGSKEYYSCHELIREFDIHHFGLLQRTCNRRKQSTIPSPAKNNPPQRNTVKEKLLCTHNEMNKTTESKIPTTIETSKEQKEGMQHKDFPRGHPS